MSWQYQFFELIYCFYVYLKRGCALPFCVDAFTAVSLKPTSMLKRDLPPNLRLLSLHDNTAFDGDSTAIIRLAHLFEAREDPELSQPASVDIADLFSDFTFTSCTEMQLSAALPLDQGRFHEHISTCPCVWYSDHRCCAITTL